jgi:protease-4
MNPKIMPGKKRPILIVVVILGITVLFLGGIMAVILNFSGSSSRLSFGEKIGVIPVEGPIVDSGPILTQLIKFRKDEAIKVIILRIDSPGGGVGPSQEIYREVRRTIEKKKVIASLGSLAASGGYYVASAANKIVANPGTITGSIGVIMEFLRLENLLKKIGVSLEVLKSGEFKDLGSPHREMSEREKALITALISDVQKQFVDAVARGRGLSVEEVMEIADGRIFSGAQAKDLGLVDRLGNFQDAVLLAKEMAEIKGEATMVYPEKPRLRIWDLFFQDASKALVSALKENIGGIGYRWNGF